MSFSRRQFIRLAVGSAAVLGGLAYLGKFFHAKTVSVHVSRKKSFQLERARALLAGFKNLGIEATLGTYKMPARADIMVVHGWKQGLIINDARKRNIPLLVMESGFFQPRDEWTSLAWNGLSGRGHYVPAGDKGERFERYFSKTLKPWREDKKGYALLIGQVPWDAALYHLDMDKWLQVTTKKLIKRGWNVLYRPHPKYLEALQEKHETLTVAVGARLSHGSLNEDLAGAAFCLTYNSNAAVEAVLAGVPTVSLHNGSIAWPVTSHDLDQPFFYPDRTRWCHDMAWRQWTLEEMAAGDAWRHVSRYLG
jgi:hypothetical protein